MCFHKLKDYFINNNNEMIKLSFKDIEKIIGKKLPEVALKYEIWWSNKDNPHLQAKTWLAAGYKTTEVKLKEYVIFKKSANNISFINLTNEILMYKQSKGIEGIYDMKNITTYLNMRSAELLGYFQWVKVVNNNHDFKELEKLKSIMGDIMIYLIILANELDIDLSAIVIDKTKY